MFFPKTQSWVFNSGLVAPTARDLWANCVLAMPFWDYKLAGVEDLSGNGLHGTFGVGLDPIADWTVSSYGAYLDAEGAASEEITVAAPPAAWLDGTSRMSIEIIFRVDTPTAGSGIIQGLLSKYATTTGRRSWRLYVVGDEVALQVSSDGVGNEIQETTNCNLGTSVWAHLVLTYDAGVFKAWKDGRALTTDGNFGTHLSIFAGVIEPLRIFARSDGNRLAGGIAGVRIWRDRILGEAEALRLYEDPWGMYEPVFPLPFLPSLAVAHVGSTPAGPWFSAGTVPKGILEKVIPGLEPGVSYDVRVKTRDTTGNTSAGSTIVAGTPLAAASGTGLASRLKTARGRSRPPPGSPWARFGRYPYP